MDQQIGVENGNEQGWWEAYRRNGDPDAFLALVELHEAMVRQICRRYLVTGEEVDDAVQETFVKLARRTQQIDGDMGAWLRRAAATTAIDATRRALRQRRYQRKLALEGWRTYEKSKKWEAVEAVLDHAFRKIDPETRLLLQARFLKSSTMNSLAAERGAKRTTISRRVARALAEVRKALARVGVESLEDAALLEAMLPGGAALPALDGIAESEARAGTGVLAGRKDRVIRVGVLVSQTTGTTCTYQGYFPTVGHQLTALPWVGSNDVRLVGLVEPGSEEVGAIECGMRDFGVMSGTLDATDPEMLKLLDVIYLGQSYAVPNRVLDAVAEAVVDGVGLYSVGAVGCTTPGINDRRVCRLLMCPKAGYYHTPGQHHLPRAARLLEEHPILDGMRAGLDLAVGGCGPVFWPEEGLGRVLITKTDAVRPMALRGGATSVARMPVVTVGQIGRGRVAIVALFDPAPVASHPTLRGNLTGNILRWLTEGSHWR